mgnify:CR=1 FL=1
MKDDFDVSPLRKKKKINSRAKGNRFENKIAKTLNERFNTKEFCRTPGSGAFATTHTLPEYLKIYGDLITPQNFKYIIECKSTISKMIAQAHRDSKKSSRKFLLFIGQNRKEPIAITNDLSLPVKGPKFQGSSGDVEIAMFRLEDLVNIDDSYFFLNDA